MPSITTAHQWYAEHDPVHGFDHILRVYHLAEHLAGAEGADIDIVRAAALLHDASREPGGQDDPHSAKRHNHQHDSAEFAGEILQDEGWPPERIAAVQHCIRAHRFRDSSEPPSSREAQVLFDADKLDAIGISGVARAIAFAARAGQPAYFPPSARFLQSGQTEPGEPHSAYHEYLFKLVRLKDRLNTPTARALAEERHRQMVDFFQALAAEWTGTFANEQKVT
jgi:uncharacterized protein